MSIHVPLSVCPAIKAGVEALHRRPYLVKHRTQLADGSWYRRLMRGLLIQHHVIHYLYQKTTLGRYLRGPANAGKWDRSCYYDFAVYTAPDRMLTVDVSGATEAGMYTLNYKTDPGFARPDYRLFARLHVEEVLIEWVTPGSAHNLKTAWPVEDWLDALVRYCTENADAPAL